MRMCVPLLGERVAPRCSIADVALFLTISRTQVTARVRVPVAQMTWSKLLRLMVERDVDTLVCGGITLEDRGAAHQRGIHVINNVAGTAGEIETALQRGLLSPGFGIVSDTVRRRPAPASSLQTPPSPSAESKESERMVDCLACPDRQCCQGDPCRPKRIPRVPRPEKPTQHMLESAQDVIAESERKLCRIAELVYFCLGMKYQKIGIAFCIELFEPTEILAGVLRRFFDVYPVCCKVGSAVLADPYAADESNATVNTSAHLSCNPVAQAAVLNEIGTDLNIIVGLCIGVDCVFIQASTAPVTTLFVKDKSLANNPIGALYSDYYLKEVTQAAIPRDAPERWHRVTEGREVN